MNIQNELDAMTARLFEGDFSDFLQKSLDEQTRLSGLDQDEAACKEALRILGEVLNEDQKSYLAAIEKNYADQQAFILPFCFGVGIWAGFGQYITGDAEKYSFQNLVASELMENPGMRKYPKYCCCRDRNIDILDHLHQELPPVHEEMLTTIDFVWDERLAITAVIMFYCGYRYAMQIINRSNILNTTSITPQILYTEYRLGLTDLYEKREKHS